MKKYINLLIKDSLLCKKMIFFVLYGPLTLLFMPTDSWISSLSVYFIWPMTMVMIIFLVVYMMEDEKNKGTELLTTTSYTRNDIVVSRYLLCFIIATLQIILTLIVMFSVLKSFSLLDTVFLSIIFLFMCVIVSVQVPLSFKFRSTTFSVISIAFEFLIILSVVFINKLIADFRSNFNPLVLSILLSSIAILFVMISIFISKKIYLKKNLG